MEQTLDGKLLPRHLTMFRDEDTGRIELRYWRFQPILIFLIPFMAVWSGGSLFGCYVLPFLRHGSHPADYAPFLFGIPFLVASVAIWSFILTLLFGSRRLVLDHGHGSYAVKLFGIGRTRNFDLRIDTEIRDSLPVGTQRPQGNVPLAGSRTMRKIVIKNGYRSESICAFWDDDAIEFVLELLKRRA